MLKTNLLTESQDIISLAEFQLMFNDWDKETVQLSNAGSGEAVQKVEVESH